MRNPRNEEIHFRGFHAFRDIYAASFSTFFSAHLPLLKRRVKITARTDQSKNMPIHTAMGPKWKARISTTAVSTRHSYMVQLETIME